MSKMKFAELVAKMTPEQQAEVEARKRDLLAEYDARSGLHSVSREQFEAMALEQSRRFKLQDVENGIDCMSDSPDDFHIVPAREYVKSLLAKGGIEIDGWSRDE
jgi:hypothetical protein